MKSILSLSSLKKEIRSLGTPERAEACAWFFKTGAGQYGEGDIFLGLTVPAQRTIAKKYADLPLSDVESLLQSKEHEFRLTALIILVGQYKNADKIKDEKGAAKIKKQIFNLYLKNTKWINNWDLVDTSAGYIVGDYLLNLTEKTAEATKMKILTKLAKSKLLWGRRIAIVSTSAFINRGRHEETIAIAKLLLQLPNGKPEHDLIHKATGWMLREVGKRASLEALLAFLHQYGPDMPRTMLRYAIEKFSPAERKMYLSMPSRVASQKIARKLISKNK
ncbi:MAG: DNA alkylation repair protein [Candidatus Pacebacteria bacterium]|nr:DNA alkylation repair protein [Candidatus Paceibacterota bacterium]MBP9851717.1 DNA alkylation repair protein [Candidatus Paceibacterota bacterium]